MSDTGDQIRRLFGWVLITAGALWTLLAGGCTLTFVSEALRSMHHASEAPGIVGFIAFAVAIGSVGASPGIALLVFGLILRRPKPSPPPTP